ncbi:MAG TPA: VanW family protein [Patescibacteria group bacterium]|nr:VanW family protein [Patescibacteria group bacterium]
MLKKIKNLIKFLSKAVLVVVLVCILLSLFSLIYFRMGFKDRVIPNVFFYGTKMTGKTGEEVYKTVSAKKAELQNQIILGYEDKSINVKISDIGFSWNDSKTARDILYVGREGNYLTNLEVWASSFVLKRDIEMAYEFDSDVLSQYLKELATSIDKESVDGKFEIKNNKVADFVIGSNGKKLLIDENVEEIKNAVITQKGTVKLNIQEVKAQNVDDMNKMGIKELVATGQSSFAYSPPNRIHNIDVGAQVFNGILIKPGENFSFITYLGEVSAKTGYLPELVIKEDKTIPEYGGGLCQVSTTFFRAAINAGFPIVERSAHAYRVVYYEPAGFDSTIYQPKPDLVFTNDTKNYILIQTRISGNDLFVDFYGTNDGRKVEVSKSTVYNLVPPGDPIMIETTELKPGEKKQTDTAHTGADAYFTRKITYSDGTVKDDRFDSHYIPWRAKFLVGKEEPKTPEVTPPESPNSNNSPDTTLVNP